MNKRTFLKSMGLLAAANTIFSFVKKTETEDVIPFTIDDKQIQEGEFTLPNLPYGYDAFMDIIDKQTMEIHHTKHHKAYVDNLNKAIKETPIKYKSLEAICQKLDKKSNMLIRNNAGGHWNHSFFWESLTSIEGMATTPVYNAITTAFGSYDTFKEEFKKAALSRFGSGWAWLCKDKTGKLFITSTPNQDNPVMKKLVDKAGIPILGIDVWEHAYYLKYQNKRADYINAFFKIIDWKKVEQRFLQ